MDDGSALRPSAEATFKYAHIRTQASALLVLIIGTLTLASDAVGAPGAKLTAYISLLLWIGLNFALLSRTELIFLGMAVPTTLAIWSLLPQPAPTLMQGLDRACLFVTFVASLNLLRDAAQTSAAVRQSGQYLIAQSPPRRYAALTLGGHAFGIALNMGALNLLGTLIRRSNSLAMAGGDARIVEIREQRMTTALSRGFAAVLMWSPMGVSAAFTLSLIPSLTWFELGPPALALATGFMAMGWVLDRLAWPASTRRAGTFRPAPRPVRDVLPMLGITMTLLIGVLAVKMMFHGSLLVAVMATVPFMALLWIMLQYRRFGGRLMLSAATRRLRKHAQSYLPQARPEAIVLASAGFLGAGVSALIDAVGFGQWLIGLQVPAAGLALGAFATILLAAQIAVPPLVSVAVVGAALTHTDPASLPPLAVALAIQAGWSLSTATSPFTGGSLMLARVIGRSPWIFQRWNAVYAVACSTALAIVLLVWLR